MTAQFGVSSGSNTPTFSEAPAHLGHTASLSLQAVPTTFGTPDAPTTQPPSYANGNGTSTSSSPTPDLPKPREGQTRRGVCKFFNSQKGFGFVLDHSAEELGGQEVFVHFTAIQSKTGFRSLAEGEEVEYEITTGPKGFQASRLTGPGGRPVMGDPKARLIKQQQPQFMQLQPIAFPGQYGMDPYVQHHPGAVYAASPYNLVYMPSMSPGQPAQYAQIIPAQAFGSPQLGGGQFGVLGNGAGRNASSMNAFGASAAPFGAAAIAQAGALGASSSFGPVGGMASTMGGGNFQAQSSFGSAFPVGQQQQQQQQPFSQNQRFSSVPNTAYGAASQGVTSSPTTNTTGSNATGAVAFAGADQSGADSNANGPASFFGSGNLLCLLASLCLLLTLLKMQSQIRRIEIS